jgi:N-acetylneuraminate synthase
MIMSHDVILNDLVRAPAIQAKLPEAPAGNAVVRLGGRDVGEGEPCYVIAEIGINHNGELELAKRLITGAKRAGCDAVKFQKRTPEVCVPRDQWELMRDTPWGRMSYIDYKRRMEFTEADFREIDRFCRREGIDWFASCWDPESVDFMEKFDTVCYKVASASVTDLELLEKIKATGRPIILSTGMSSSAEIHTAVQTLGLTNLLIAHATSTYPCPVEELNLKMIQTLKQRYPSCPVGYSGHETGLAPTWAAVALGATFVERHITLDRAMWGTDHAASVEVAGMEKLVDHIRDIQKALGDGIKRVYESELPFRRKLRRVSSVDELRG